MGISGISIWQILILLLIVILVFGTKKLRNVGSDLGAAIRDFRKGMNEPDKEQAEETAPEPVARSESAADREPSSGDPDAPSGKS